MDRFKSVLTADEIAVFNLRALYSDYGYERYKMSKFEEYDLYAKNKDFLTSKNVITFTDSDGRLLALKPDVTLSIIRNTKDRPSSISKTQYNENIYRICGTTKSFREIMQVGLEAIGAIDDYCIYEVLKLAADSLACTDRNCILEFSHLGVLSELLNYLGIPEEEHATVLHSIGEKNAHELMKTCNALCVPAEKSAILKELVTIYGKADDVLPQITALLTGVISDETLSEFKRIANALNSCDRKDLFRIDFSIISDIRYYNGFVFRGFAEGIPNSVLSGGQYDTMMKQMKRTSKAIGFAVYVDLLEQFEPNKADFDVDNLLLYDDTCTIADIEAQTRQFTEKGESVLVQKQTTVLTEQLPASNDNGSDIKQTSNIRPASNIKYRRLITLTKGEVNTVEENA